MLKKVTKRQWAQSQQHRQSQPRNETRQPAGCKPASRVVVVHCPSFLPPDARRGRSPPCPTTSTAATRRPRPPAPTTASSRACPVTPTPSPSPTAACECSPPAGYTHRLTASIAARFSSTFHSPPSPPPSLPPSFRGVLQSCKREFMSRKMSGGVFLVPARLAEWRL